MAGWDEAWLRQHEAKMAGGGVLPLPDRFGFTLPYALPSLNKLLRMHWSERKKEAKRMSESVAAVTAHLPKGAKPPEHARVTVVRYASRAMDEDNLYGSVKHLLDVLQPKSERHPFGLGLIAGDDPAHLTVTVRFERSSRAAARTSVLVEKSE